MQLRALAMFAVVSCGAVGPADSGLDAGLPVDGGASDSGIDAGEQDAGRVDAGVTDASASDAGMSDAGLTDSGVIDAGADAGGTDAGFDAGARLFVFTGAGNGEIRAFAFNAADGGLTALATVNGGNGTSFLAIDVARRRLYATNEGSAQIAAFALNPADARLQFLNRVSSGGNGPAHVSVDGTGRFVFAANYGAGSVSVLPVVDAGLAAPSQTLASGGQAHQIFTDPTNRFAYVACKAADHLAQYAFSDGTLTPLAPAIVSTAAGAGPRHVALHPTQARAYLINELDSTLQTLSVSAAGALTSLQTLSTLPAGFTGTNTGAEVAVHPNGRFVFGSNRGHNSIAAFRVDATSGQLTLVGHTSTGGQTPRHFSLDPEGRWLIVANQGSNSIFLFRVDPLTGALTSLGNVATVTSPAYVGFVDLR